MTSTTTEFTPEMIFSRWAQRAEANPDEWRGIDAVYRWEITGDGGGTWTVDCTERPAVTKGSEGKPDCIIRVNASDFIGIVKGETNPQTAFLMGRVKIAGGIEYALRLNALLGDLMEKEDLLEGVG